MWCPQGFRCGCEMTKMFVSHLKDLISTNCQYSYSCGVQVEVFFGNGVIMCSLADRLNQVCHG